MKPRHSVSSRRRFLQVTAGVVATPLLGRRAWSASRRPPPSGRVTMGLIGCGGMGNADLHSFLQFPEVQVVAVCDPDRGRRLGSQRTVERHYAAQAASGDWSDCTVYNDYRELLARDDIDAVIIASPDHWHALHVVHAARAGKDIYGEKPLSLTVRQGRVMSDTVLRFGRVFQTGSQQRSDPRFRQACELVRNGRLGAMRRVTCGLPAGEVTGNHPPKPVPEGFDYDLWLGPAPAEPYCEHRTHYEFRHLLDYSGGKLTDWGAHHIDIAQWALGTHRSGPLRVEGEGSYPADGLWNAPVDYRLECRYENDVLLIVTDAEENGVRFEGDEGWIFVSRERIEAEPHALLDSPIRLHERKLPLSRDHHGNFLECLRSRGEPVAPIEEAHRSITIAHLGNIALKLGRPIDWDPAREQVLRDPVAERLLDRPMRAPWSL